MIALLSLVFPLAIGWVWVEASAALPPRGGWAVRILQAGLAAAVGFGVSSLVFLLLAMAGLAKAPVLAACELALIAGGAVCLRRAGAARRASRPAGESPYRWTLAGRLLVVALCVCSLLAAGIVVRTVAAAPHGNWDAWAIWNLRARYLAGDGAWQHAVSPLLAQSHPEYPLGTSSLIARAWVYGGRDFSPVVPAAIGGLYGLATLLVVTGALAVFGGPLLAALGGCVLLSATGWVAAIGTQYADVPLALYFTSAVVLLAAPSPLLAGVLAGLAATVKNEGLAFALVLLLALAVTRAGRKSLIRYCLGLAPLLAWTLVFKLAIAPAADPAFRQGLGAMLRELADPSAWGVVLGNLAGQTWALGPWYAHPLVLAAAVLLAFGVRERAREELLSLWLAFGLMLAVYLAVILLLPADLNWQIETSMDRLLLQILPAALVSALLAVQPPARPVPKSEEQAAARASGKRRRLPPRP